MKGNKFWYVQDIEYVKKYGHTDDDMDRIFASEKEAKKYKKDHDGEIIKMMSFFVTTVAYKSGNKFTGLFHTFVIENNYGTKNYTWVEIENNKYSTPLFMGVNEIESVWVEKEGFIYKHNDEVLYVLGGVKIK